MRNHRVDIIGQSTIIMVSAKLDNWFTQSMFATGLCREHIWATTLPCHQHQEKHLNKNIIPIEKEYWIVTFPFERQSKMCRTVKWQHGGAFCQKNFWQQKNVRILNISKFSPKKHQKDRGDPQMAGQCYLIFTLSDPVIKSDLRQLNSACSLKRAQFGNKTNCKNGPIHI